MQSDNTQAYQECIKQAIEGTNVITSEQFTNSVFTSEESRDKIKSKIQDINFAELVKIVPTGSIQWRSLDQDSKGGKQKGSIVKFYPGKGSIHGVGGLYTGMIIIQDIQSKFPTHAFSFDTAKQPLLKDSLQELASHKEEIGYKEFKDLVQLSLTFQLFSEETDYQTAEVLEQVKNLELMRQIISATAIRDSAASIDMPKNPIITTAGFIQKKYDNYLQADVAKMTAVMNLMNLSSKAGCNDSVEIVSFDRATNKLRDLSNECKTISDYINLLRNKRMDLVLYIDSVSIKKTGREVAVMPKLRIHQIILHDYVEKKQSTLGLRLAQKTADV